MKAISLALSDPTFTPPIMSTKSSTAEGLLMACIIYYEVVVSVEPKKMPVRSLSQQLANAN